MKQFHLSLQLALHLQAIVPDGVDANGDLSLSTSTFLDAIADWVVAGEDVIGRQEAAVSCIRFLNKQAEEEG